MNGITENEREAWTYTGFVPAMAKTKPFFPEGGGGWQTQLILS